MDTKLMIMDDPVLSAGSARTATASITITPAGIACTAELYLSLDNGVTKVVTSGQIALTTTGMPQQVSLPITMPSPTVGQSYGVYLVVVSGGVSIGSYKATDNVIIPVVGTPTINW